MADRAENAAAKGIQEKQTTSFFANGLDGDLLCTTYHSSRSQTRTSHNDPDQRRCDGELGCDHGDRTRQIGGHLKATKTLDDNSQTSLPFLDMFGLNERMQDSQGQVRTQGNALELLEVAMWVALTQHQTCRKFLFEHPAYASSWNSQMVSLVTGLKGSDAHNSRSVYVGDG